jgi:tight adherence protein C
MLILALCVGLMALFLALALFGSQAPGPAEQRLQRIGSGEVDTKPSEPITVVEDDDSMRSRVARVLSLFAGSGARGEDDKVYGSVRQRLVEAGFRRSSALGVYMGSRVVLGASLSALSILASWSIGKTPPFLIIGMAAAVGYIAPGIIVDRLRAIRQSAIQRGLADAIDMMVVCVEAGLGLGPTLSRVAKEFGDAEPIIADEFRITVAETQAGRGLMNSLRSMAKRTGNQELNTLVALLIQTERFGTPLSQTLRSQADAMRFQRMQYAEEQAQKAPVKMMFPAGLIFLAVLLILGGPAAISIMRTFEQ